MMLVFGSFHPRRPEAAGVLCLAGSAKGMPKDVKAELVQVSFRCGASTSCVYHHDSSMKRVLCYLPISGVFCLASRFLLRQVASPTKLKP